MANEQTSLPDRFGDIVLKQKKFNGKPYSHWQEMADELVVELIIRAAMQHTDPRSLVGHLARNRLMEIAHGESPTLFQRVLAQRDRCMEGFGRIMSELKP